MIVSSQPAAAPRDLVAVGAAIQQLDAAVTRAQSAVAIEIPKGGMFGDSAARDAAVAQRVSLLAPAAVDAAAAVQILRANGGYDTGYDAPRVGLGDNAEDLVRILNVAVKDPIKHKWYNDMPWDSKPVTTLEQMVGYVTDFATRAAQQETKLSVAKMGALTNGALYAQRATELEPAQLQGLHDAVQAVQAIRTTSFIDANTEALLAPLPREVLGADGSLTTEPASLEALEQLHRSTVTQHGGQSAQERIATQLARASELAAAGDTTGARDIYEALAAGA